MLAQLLVERRAADPEPLRAEKVLRSAGWDLKSEPITFARLVIAGGRQRCCDLAAMLQCAISTAGRYCTRAVLQRTAATRIAACPTRTAGAVSKCPRADAATSQRLAATRCDSLNRTR